MDKKNPDFDKYIEQYPGDLDREQIASEDVSMLRQRYEAAFEAGRRAVGSVKEGHVRLPDGREVKANMICLRHQDGTLLHRWHTWEDGLPGVPTPTLRPRTRRRT